MCPNGLPVPHVDAYLRALRGHVDCHGDPRDAFCSGQGMWECLPFRGDTLDEYKLVSANRGFSRNDSFCKVKTAEGKAGKMTADIFDGR